MKKSFCFIIIYLFSMTWARADVQSDAFKKAQEDYAAGNKTAAIKSLLTLEADGVKSSALYYNLGTMYLSMDSISQAVYFLEKAHRIAPFSSDIKNNLDNARSRTIDNIQPMPKLFFIKWKENIQNTFSSSTWAIFFILLIFSLVALIIFILQKPTSKWQPARIGASVLCVLLLGMTFLNAWNQKKYEQLDTIGINFDSQTKGYSQPFSNADEVFTIHEGAKFVIQERKQDWSYILLADGRDGWIENVHYKVL